MPKDIIESGHIRLYKSRAAVLTEIGKVILVVVIFFALKQWLFNTIYNLSGWTFAANWAQISFLFWPTVIIAGLILLNIILSRRTSYYEIFPDRVIVRSGVLSRSRRSIDMDQFAAVSMYQSFWGRLVGYGDIVFMFEALATIVTQKGIVLHGVTKPARLLESAAQYIKEGKYESRGAVANKQAMVASKVGEKVPVEREKSGVNEVVTEAPPQLPVEEIEKPVEEPSVKPMAPSGPISGEITIS